MKLSLFILCILPLSILLNSCSSVELKNNGINDDKLIIIDGNIEEWSEHISRYADEQIFYAADNSKDYLYFVLVLKDKRISKAVINRGLKFSFNNSINDIEFIFPRPNKGKNKSKYLDNFTENLNQNNLIVFEDSKKEVKFFDDNFEIKSNYINNELIFELKIPLSKNKFWKETLMNLSTLDLSISLNEMSKNDKRNRFDSEEFGGEEGSFGSMPDRTGRAGRGNYAGGRPEGRFGNRHNTINLDLDFSIHLKKF